MWSSSLQLEVKLKFNVALFSIQATTVYMILDGSDLVGQARTGQANTGYYAAHIGVVDEWAF